MKISILSSDQSHPIWPWTFMHVSEAHLARYLAEFDFRYNHRSGLGIEDTERTNELLRNVAGKRLTYRRPSEGAVA